MENKHGEICGEPCGDGSKCKRPAGWGTDEENGPCKDHNTDRRALRKFDQATRQQILGATRTGAFKQHVAQVAGITEQTLRNWINWGREDIDNGFEDTELAQFYLDYNQARGAGAIETLREVRPEFVAERAYGYTKTERHEHLVDSDADLESDSGEYSVVTGDETPADAPVAQDQSDRTHDS